MLNVSKIWLTDSAVWIRTADGREASEPFARYPRLLHASKALCSLPALIACK